MMDRPTIENIADKYGDNEDGEQRVIRGYQLKQFPRLRTGFFGFDFATGGGFPVGQTSMIYGPYSSGKTTIVLSALAEFQRQQAEVKEKDRQSAVFIDAESVLEPEWAQKQGVDMDQLYYGHPTDAEEVVDMFIDFYTADRCGLIILDSLAALGKRKEMENSAEVGNVGGHGLIFSKFARKISSSDGHLKVRGIRPPTVIMVNQRRTKINARNPAMTGEAIPGGDAFMHLSAMIIRVQGKDLKDPKVHGTLDVVKEINGEIKKHKCKVCSSNFTTAFAKIPMPAYSMGQPINGKMFKEQAERLGVLKKIKGGWAFGVDEYRTQKELFQKVASDPALAAQYESMLIDAGFVEVYGAEDTTDNKKA